MDVSRISMTTPKIIDWRRLTAKEIIKYDNEGINVPQEYLSWARAFRVDLEKNDTDETTYEMAISKPTTPQNNQTQTPTQAPLPEQNNNAQNNEVEPESQPNQPEQTTSNTPTTTQQPIQNEEENVRPTQLSQAIQTYNNLQQNNGTQQGVEQNGQNQTVQPTQLVQNQQQQVTNNTTPTTNTTTEQTQTTNSTEEGEPTETNPRTETEEEQEEKMTADEKRKKMEEEGQDIISIAKTFISESSNKGNTANEKSNDLTTIGEASDNAIASLDSYMSDLLGQANDLKSQLNNIKNKGNKNQSDFSKALQIEDELKNLGTTGQNVALGYDTDLNLYQATINDGTTIGVEAQDYGNTTIDLKKEVKNILFNIPIIISLESIGKYAVSAGKGLQDNGAIISDKNNANRSTIQDSQTNIYNTTGVSAGEVSGDNRLAEQNGTTTTGQNTGTQNTKTGEKATDKTNPNSKTNTDIAKTETLMKKAEKEESNITDDKKTEVEKKQEKIASGNLDEILKRKMRKGEAV